MTSIFTNKKLSDVPIGELCGLVYDYVGLIWDVVDIVVQHIEMEDFASSFVKTGSKIKEIIGISSSICVDEFQ